MGWRGPWPINKHHYNDHGTRVEDVEVNFVAGAYTGNNPHQIKKKKKEKTWKHRYKVNCGLSF